MLPSYTGLNGGRTIENGEVQQENFTLVIETYRLADVMLISQKFAPGNVTV